MWTKRNPFTPRKTPREVVVKCPVRHKYIGGAPDELRPALVADYKFFCPTCKAWRHIFKEDIVYGQI